MMSHPKKHIESDPLIIRHLPALQDYCATWHAMQQFTNQRTDETFDEIWTLEHPPVFTQGQNGKAEHILAPGNIPVIPVDRGGQVTYHGPGQLVIYTLIDMKRKKLNIREIVTVLEQSVIKLLAEYHIDAKAHCKAPGVYIENKKICSVGLRIRRGCTFHGLAFNVAMDLDPFLRINPCGFSQLEMTQLSAFDASVDIKTITHKLVAHLSANLGYNNTIIKTEKWYGTEKCK
jgi:lipoyl(octanoyl) transferase